MASWASLNDLPSELINKIFSYLDYKDLVNCKYLNRRLYELAKEESHWKALCQKYWLETLCPPGFTWELFFIERYEDLGQYITCYASIKESWDKVTSYFKVNCPTIYQDIKAGASECMLNEAEEYIGVGKFPLDMRCSYRIHNGQKRRSPGLMGNICFRSIHRTECLLDLAGICFATKDKDGLKGCVALTLCNGTDVIQYLAVNDSDGYEPNTIFYAAKRNSRDNMQYIDAFITGYSFQEWFACYANHLANNDYGNIQNEQCRFLRDREAEVTTGSVTVSVYTCFLPDISKVNPPEMRHAYKVTISMADDAPQSETCELEARHWIQIDANGCEVYNHTHALVRSYPALNPGATLSWLGTTTFHTLGGMIKGCFWTRNLETGERVNVGCPTVDLKCYPYITAKEREATKAEKKKRKMKRRPLKRKRKRKR